jgi:molybdopterin synthase sulfur carrier subunit
MAQVHFTAWLREWAPTGPVSATGATVGEALTSLFKQEPQIRSYVVDERGALRKHVCIFADGQRLARDTTMSHPIAPDSKLYVMQALSGG